MGKKKIITHTHTSALQMQRQIPRYTERGLYTYFSTEEKKHFSYFS